jgi:hypothetical protein
MVPALVSSFALALASVYLASVPATSVSNMAAAGTIIARWASALRQALDEANGRPDSKS